MIASGIVRLSRLVSRLTLNLCVVVVYVMLTLLVVQVLMRYLFGSPPSWTEEVAIILFPWLVLLCASVGVRERFHVTLSILNETNPLIQLSDRLVAAIIGGFGILLMVYGTAYMLRTSGQKTAAMRMPVEVLYFCIPVFGALILLHAVAILIDPEKEMKESNI